MPSERLHQLLLQKGLSASPAPLPGMHCAGVCQQTGFPDISVATWPDAVCVVDAVVPLWDSASSLLCLGRCAGCQHFPSCSCEDGTGLSSYCPCAPIHTGCKLCLSVTPSIPLKHCAQLWIAPDSRWAGLQVLRW